MSSFKNKKKDAVTSSLSSSDGVGCTQICGWAPNPFLGWQSWDAAALGHALGWKAAFSAAGRSHTQQVTSDTAPLSFLPQQNTSWGLGYPSSAPALWYCRKREPRIPLALPLRCWRLEAEQPLALSPSCPKNQHKSLGLLEKLQSPGSVSRQALFPACGIAGDALLCPRMYPMACYWIFCRIFSLSFSH